MQDQVRALEGWGILAGIPALFVVAFLLWFVPGFEHLPLCAVRSFLGVDCPGCGLSRSFAALTHGHLRASIDYHPLGIVIAAWLIVLFGRKLFLTITARTLPALLSQRARDWLVAGFLFALIVQWLVKLILA
jgi:Protein of unknown function (DUF2752)